MSCDPRSLDNRGLIGSMLGRFVCLIAYHAGLTDPVKGREKIWGFPDFF